MLPFGEFVDDNSTILLSF